MSTSSEAANGHTPVTDASSAKSPRRGSTLTDSANDKLHRLATASILSCIPYAPRCVPYEQLTADPIVARRQWFQDNGGEKAIYDRLVALVEEGLVTAEPPGSVGAGSSFSRQGSSTASPFAISISGKFKRPPLLNAKTQSSVVTQRGTIPPPAIAVPAGQPAMSQSRSATAGVLTRFHKRFSRSEPSGLRAEGTSSLPSILLRAPSPHAVKLPRGTLRSVASTCLDDAISEEGSICEDSSVYALERGDYAGGSDVAYSWTFRDLQRENALLRGLSSQLLLRCADVVPTHDLPADSLALLNAPSVELSDVDVASDRCEVLLRKAPSLGLNHRRVPGAWVTINVFVSSTFKDMHSERDLLTRIVFPKLNSYCRSRRVTLVPVDLRWGLTSEDTENAGALQLCLDEIDRSRGWFIALVGKRYGWVPDSYKVSTNEHEWVQAVPPGKSITEMEIQHGFLRHRETPVHALTLMRDPAFLADVPEGMRSMFVEDDPSKAEQLTTLCEELLHHPLNTVVRNYPCRYVPGSKDGILEGLERFEDEVEKFLWRAVEEEFPISTSHIDAIAMETFFHDELINSQQQCFIRRRDIMFELEEYVDSDGGHHLVRGTLVVAGEIGTGKTALLANLVSQYTRGRPEVVVLPYFVGASPQSTDVRYLLWYLCGRLLHFTGQSDQQANSSHTTTRSVRDQDYRSLCQALPVLLERVAEKFGMVLLVIDGLNRLDPHLYHAHRFAWLPKTTPRNVRIVVSTIPGSLLDALTTKSSKVVIVPKLLKRESDSIVSARMAQYRKRLDSSQLDLLLSKKEAPIALYLTVACEEMRHFGDFDRLGEFIADLPPSVPLLFNHWLARIEGEHAPHLVQRALSLFAVSRGGLQERELLILLRDENHDRLPQAHWARLYSSIRLYINTAGEGCLDFFYSQLEVAVRRRYLCDCPEHCSQFDLGHYCKHVNAGVLAEDWETKDGKLHGELAEFFKMEAQAESGRGWLGPDRALTEMVYHMTQARMWEEVAEILCDLTFIRSMISRGLVYNLLRAYVSVHIALSSLVRIERMAAAVATLWGGLAIDQNPTKAKFKSGVHAMMRRCGIKKDKLALRVPGISIPEMEAVLQRVGEYWTFVNASSRVLDARPELTLQEAANLPLDALPSIKANQMLAHLPPELRVPWLQLAVKPTGKQLHNIDLQHATDIAACALSPDDQYALTVDTEGRCKMWCLTTGEELDAIPLDHEGFGTARSLSCCTFSNDGTLFTTGGHGMDGAGMCVVWNTTSRAPVSQISLTSNAGSVKAVSYSPNAKNILAIAVDCSIGDAIHSGPQELASNSVRSRVSLARSGSLSMPARRRKPAVKNRQRQLSSPMAPGELEDRPPQYLGSTLGAADKEYNSVPYGIDEEDDPFAEIDAALAAQRNKDGSGTRRRSADGTELPLRTITFDSNIHWKKSSDSVSIDESLILSENESEGSPPAPSPVLWSSMESPKPPHDPDDSDIITVSSEPPQIHQGDNVLHSKQAPARRQREIFSSGPMVRSASMTRHGSYKHLVESLDSEEFNRMGALVLATTEDGAFAVAHPHRGTVLCCTFVGDDYCVTGSNDCALAVTRVEDGEVVRVIADAHASAVTCVAAWKAERAPTRRVVTGSEDDTLVIWDSTGPPEDWTKMHVCEGHDNSVVGVSISPDGTRVFSCSKDDTLRVWSTEDGTQLSLFKGEDLTDIGCHLSSNGGTLATFGTYGVRLWETRSIDIATSKKTQDGSITAIAFNTSGSRFVSGSGDIIEEFRDAKPGSNNISVYDTTAVTHSLLMEEEETVASTPLQLHGHTKSVTSVVFSPDGTLIASTSEDCTWRLWDSTTGELLHVCPSPGGGPVYEVLFSSCGKMVCITSEVLSKDAGDQTESSTPRPRVAPPQSLDMFVIRDKEPPHFLWTLEGTVEFVYNPVWSDDGLFLLAWTGKGVSPPSSRCSLRMWDTRSGKCVASLTMPWAALDDVEEPVEHRFYPFNPAYVIVGCRRRGISLYHVSPAGFFEETWSHSTPGDFVCFSSCGVYMAAGGVVGQASKRVGDVTPKTTTVIFANTNPRSFRPIPIPSPAACVGQMSVVDAEFVGRYFLEVVMNNNVESLGMEVKIWDCRAGLPLCSATWPHRIAPLCIASRAGLHIGMGDVEGVVSLLGLQGVSLGDITYNRIVAAHMAIVSEKDGMFTLERDEVLTLRCHLCSAVQPLPPGVQEVINKDDDGSDTSGGPPHGDTLLDNPNLVAVCVNCGHTIQVMCRSATHQPIIPKGNATRRASLNPEKNVIPKLARGALSHSASSPMSPRR